MMGKRQFGVKLYYQLSLDQLVPEDHLLRRIAAAVDFSFVRALCGPVPPLTKLLQSRN